MGAAAPPRRAAGQLGLPRAALRGLFQPQTLNPAARTVELVFTTGARVARTDFWTGERFFEELEVSEQAIDLGRLKGGANLLADHDAFRIASVLGVVEDAWLEGANGVVRVRFSERPEVEPIYTDVRTGILRNASVAYLTHELEELPVRKGETPVLRATRWEPLEVSLVAVPADAGAQVRAADSGDAFPCHVRRLPPMADDVTTRQHDPHPEPEPVPDDDEEEAPPKPPKTAAAADDPPDVELGDEDTAPAARRLERLERTRVQGILRAVRSARLPDAFGDELIAGGVALDRARAAVLAELERRTLPVGGAIQVGDRGATRLRKSIEAAMLYRAAPGLHPLGADGVGREYTGASLFDMARDCLEAAGIACRGRSRHEVAGIALGIVRPDGQRSDGFIATSDFAGALLTLGRVSLTDGFVGAPRTFPPWTRQGSLPDYRTMTRIALGMAPKLLLVPEHAEYAHGALDLHAEQIKLQKWGRILAFTREALINDDLGAFTRLGTQFGYSAASMESDAVYGLLTGNPVMADGQPLFSAAHKNLAPAGTIDLAHMTTARQMMTTQTSSNGQFLNLQPMFLICGPLMEVAALQFTSSTIVPTAPTSVIPSFFRALQVIVDPRIQDSSWFLAASPNQIDTIEYAYMEGEAGPQIESKEGWHIDGTDFKCREDFGAAAIEWRGMVKTQSTTTLEASAPTDGEHVQTQLHPDHPAHEAGRRGR